MSHLLHLLIISQRSCDTYQGSLWGLRICFCKHLEVFSPLLSRSLFAPYSERLSRLLHPRLVSASFTGTLPHPRKTDLSISDSVSIYSWHLHSWEIEHRCCIRYEIGIFFSYYFCEFLQYFALITCYRVFLPFSGSVHHGCYESMVLSLMLVSRSNIVDEWGWERLGPLKPLISQDTTIERIDSEPPTLVSFSAVPY